MAGKNNMIPLHKTVHWRNLRNIIEEGFCHVFGNKDGKTIINSCDLKNITCYRCRGIDLHGKNVKFVGYPGRHCFVDDNSYEIFEIKTRLSSKDYDESYYVFAHNVSFDYWIICRMEIKNQVQNGKYFRNVKYCPFYDGAITFNSGHYVFAEEASEYNCKRGKMITDRYFDQDGARASAYGTTYTKYLKDHYGHQKTIVDKSSVKIYKKKSNGKKGR